MNEYDDNEHEEALLVELLMSNPKKTARLIRDLYNVAEGAYYVMRLVFFAAENEHFKTIVESDALLFLTLRADEINRVLNDELMDSFQARHDRKVDFDKIANDLRGDC